MECTYHLSSRDQLWRVQVIDPVDPWEDWWSCILFHDQQWGSSNQAWQSSIFWESWKFWVIIPPFEPYAVTQTSAPLNFFYFPFLFNSGVQNEWIIAYFPTQEEFQEITCRYEENFMSGCRGSVDVIHVKWSKCPASNFNQFTSKDRYCLVCFSVIIGYDFQVLGVLSFYL